MLLLAAPLLAQHQGDLWLPAIRGEDVTTCVSMARMPRVGYLVGRLVRVRGPEQRDAGADALASYDEEMLDNLQMYWRHPSKINSPITDNLFELRREVVDEAHGGKLVALSAAQQARLEQIMVGSLRGL